VNDYFVRSERLGFRVWAVDDLELALGLWGDAEVTPHIGGPFSRDQVRARLEREIAMQAEHGTQYWPVFLLTTGEHVGCCGLLPFTRLPIANLRPDRLNDRVYELGFHIRKAHWGRGYAWEAAEAVIAYAFGRVGAVALFAGHQPANTAARRLLLKLGFNCTGDDYYAPSGLHHPSYVLLGPVLTDQHDGANG
jgi:ribosomal-protein-alanine N-acetyltransferase